MYPSCALTNIAKNMITGCSVHKVSENSQVGTYDSISIKLDAESRSTVLHIFGLKSSSDIVMVSMQQQSGGTDCGPFAIAVMTSLVFNDDPSKITSQ